MKATVDNMGQKEIDARVFLGPRTDGVPESTYLRSVLALVVNRERLEKAVARASRAD